VCVPTYLLLTVPSKVARLREKPKRDKDVDADAEGADADAAPGLKASVQHTIGGPARSHLCQCSSKRGARRAWGGSCVSICLPALLHSESTRGSWDFLREPSIYGVWCLDV
jgi:hypothetical protein